MSMTHAEKVEAMRSHMRALGVPASTAAPPAWRLLWRLGLETPPPLFLGFWPGALVMGGFFGLSWCLLMWLLLWRSQLPAWAMLLSAGAAGLLFGLIMAGYFRYLARKHALPAWSEYRGMPVR